MSSDLPKVALLFEGPKFTIVRLIKDININGKVTPDVIGDALKHYDVVLGSAVNADFISSQMDTSKVEAQLKGRFILVGKIVERTGGGGKKFRRLENLREE
jgi:hypothetical protein